MDKLLTVAELAAVLGTTPRGVYLRLARNSSSIPLPVIVPGSSSLRWRQSDVEAWLAALPVRATGHKPPRNRASRGAAPDRGSGRLGEVQGALTPSSP